MEVIPKLDLKKRPKALKNYLNFVTSFRDGVVPADVWSTITTSTSEMRTGNVRAPIPVQDFRPPDPIHNYLTRWNWWRKISANLRRHRPVNRFIKLVTFFLTL